jgi:hypothetical protein
MHQHYAIAIRTNRYDAATMAMRDFSAISELPQTPAVYALCAGDRVNDFVAYIGISSKLRGRIYQHLVMRDSSATVESAPIRINVDSISSLRWWEDIRFQNRGQLEGAELVAFEILKPTMRSRGRVSGPGSAAFQDQSFRRTMMTLFESPPTGTLRFPGVRDLQRRLVELEKRIEALESK